MIYVDELFSGRPYKECPRRHRNRMWCHLWTDGPLRDLHAFAARIGLKRAWFQPRTGPLLSAIPHYDLVETKRCQAIQSGAEPMPMTDYLRNLAGDEMWRSNPVPNRFRDAPPGKPRPILRNRHTHCNGPKPSQIP